MDYLACVVLGLLVGAVVMRAWDGLVIADQRETIDELTDSNEALGRLLVGAAPGLTPDHRQAKVQAMLARGRAMVDAHAAPSTPGRGKE